jgi:hypothetical protein
VNKCSLVACARWEQRYIVEWLEYNRSIGFDHVYLYCNDDDPQELYEAAYPFLTGSQPFVTFRHFGLQGQQRQMYRHFVKNYARETEWFSFIDIDEFLTIKKYKSVYEWISQEHKFADCILLNWLFAGDSGHRTRPVGRVLNNYIHRAAQFHPFTKCIVRSSAVDFDKFNLGPPDTFWHSFAPMLKDSSSTVNAIGQDARNYYDNFPNLASEKIQSSGFFQSTFDSAFILHVAFRSESDLKLRVDRGLSGDFSAQKMWLDLHQKGSSAIRDFMEHLNAVEDLYWFNYSKKMFSPPLATRIIDSPPGINLALMCKATQSSISRWSRKTSCSQDAEGLVDGALDGAYHCHTAEEIDPWWQVDLGMLREIREIRIFNRMDGAGSRFCSAKLSSSIDGKKWSCIVNHVSKVPYGGIDGRPFIWKSNGNPIQAQFIKLTIPGLNMLSLNQIEIY